MNKFGSYVTALCLGFVTLGLSLCLASCQIAPVIGSRLEHEELVDGIYEGSYRSLPNSAVVRVTITGGRIVNVELVKHFASWKGNKAAKVIPERILSEQSTSVDVVTGATNSSRVIMNAVQRAVERARKRAGLKP